jgi:hypothetical protein
MDKIEKKHMRKKEGSDEGKRWGYDVIYYLTVTVEDSMESIIMSNIRVGDSFYFVFF